MGTSNRGYTQLPRRIPSVEPLSPIDYIHTQQPFNPGWEEQAAKRKAVNHAYEQRAYVKRMRAMQSTPRKQRVTKEEWREILERYFYRCYYCFGYSKTGLTQDRYIPVSKGGKHVKSNIVPACQSCNSRKGNRPAEHYNPFYTPE